MLAETVSTVLSDDLGAEAKVDDAAGLEDEIRGDELAVSRHESLDTN